MVPVIYTRHFAYREGICGSCFTNIMDENTLACTKGSDDGQVDRIKIYPRPHLSVLNDLVPDLTSFFARHTLLQRANVNWFV